MQKKKKTTKKEKDIGEEIEETVEDLGKEIGKITHYFAKIGVAVVELVKDLNLGDVVRIKGITTDFMQKIDSMQVEHKEVKKAKKGEAIGLRVKEKVREQDKVYKIEE